ncbi:MAG: hypothetical protein SH848_19390 [Saprospiraceae bacterium]|nr:hypothetical protein [Saprospiraceae bacterium]
MNFQRAAEDIKDDLLKERLWKLLNRWSIEKLNVVKNLTQERFLGDAEMDYLLRRLADFPDYFPIPDIEDALRREFYSWLQLKGKPAIFPEDDYPLLGVAIPYERLEGHFMKEYGTIFPSREVFARFIDDITNQVHPHVWLKRKKYDHLRIKPDYQLHWFYWEASGNYTNPLALFDTGQQVKDGLRLPEISARYDRQLLFAFSTDRAHNLGADLALFRPTFCDADFMAEYEPAHLGEFRFGVVNRTYQVPKVGAKVVLAEAVARSGYLKLAYLKQCKALS